MNTPLPWHHVIIEDGWDGIRSEDGTIICNLVYNNPDNASFIARACNSHAELLEALETIVTWSDAYPLDVFPEPDFKKAHQLLQAGGMTLDAISASNMRHVVEGVGKIAKQAIAKTKESE